MRRLFALTICLTMISGCGALQALLDALGGNQTQETGSAKLIPFTSEKELRDYFTGQVRSHNSQYTELSFDRDGNAAPPTSDTDNGTASPTEDSQDSGGDTPGFSNTTTQEVGVDESDVVKTDGQNLYIMSSGDEGSMLRIVQAAPVDGMTQVAEVLLEGYGRELYLLDADDTVVALSETGGGYYYIDPIPVDDPAFAEPDVIGGSYAYERPRTVVTVIDVATPDQPQVLSTTAFDGTAASSRMIDGVMHLVLANYPEYYFDVMPMLGRPELNTATIETEDVVPTYRREDADDSVIEGPVVSYDELYRPTDPDGFGMVTVVSVDIRADAAFTAVGVVAAPGLIYSSLNAMYLTDTKYTFDGESRETTDVYKFAYENRGARPVAAGTVPGRVLNQYSMSEYQGHLRVATTVGPVWGLFGQIAPSTNNVYVLNQNGDGLETMGRIENIAPGETIQACRFVAAKGFLVTFEQIDPLFTIDLTDPTNPALIGELKIPGFSTFLMPMDETHMLAVGQYIPEAGNWIWGVELSIFDVSDFANPQRTAHVILGEDSGANSEALHNPKALTYFQEQGLVAIPISEYTGWVIDTVGFVDGDDAVGGSGSSGSGDATVTDVDAVPPDGGDEPPPDSGTGGGSDLLPPQPFNGLVVFRVGVETGFTELGRINTEFTGNWYYWASFARGVFIGDNVYAVTDRGVRATPVDDMAATLFEVAFPIGDLPPGVVEPTEPVGVVDPSGSTEPSGDVPVDSPSR